MTAQEQTDAIKRDVEKRLAKIGAVEVHSNRHGESFVRMKATMPGGRLITVQIQEGPA